MAAFLPYGGVTFPSQGSSRILEAVKHFETEVSFDDLQTRINLWLILLSSNVIKNRASIRNISFHIERTSPPQPTTKYYAQVHYILIGDADDQANL